jgi:hypothetical protein
MNERWAVGVQLVVVQHVTPPRTNVLKLVMREMGPQVPRGALPYVVQPQGHRRIARQFEAIKYVKGNTVKRDEKLGHLLSNPFLALPSNILRSEGATRNLLVADKAIREVL